MPFVQIITGTDFLTSEQKIKLNKAVMESMLRVFQEEKGIKPSIDIIIQEHPPDNFLINGETLTEIRKKR